jgi:hypothetical protein
VIAESLMLGVKIFGPHQAWDLGRRCPFEEPRAPLLLISLKLDEKIVSRAFLVVRLSCRGLATVVCNRGVSTR